MNKKKLMAMALAASIAVGGVATPFTSFAAEGDEDKPIVDGATDTQPGSTDTEKPTPAPKAETGEDTDKKSLPEEELNVLDPDRVTELARLKSAIARAEAVDRTKYTEKSLADLDSVLKNAKAAVNSTGQTSSRLRALADALEVQIVSLVVKDETEKAKLDVERDRISELNVKFNALTPAEYTPVSYNALKTAREAALAGRDNPAATVAQLRALADTFANKFDALTKKEDEASKIKELRDQIAALRSKGNGYLNNSNYTADSRKALSDALAAANLVTNKDNATVGQLEEALKNLSAAIAVFEKENAITEAEKIKEAKRELLANIGRGKEYLNSKRYTKASRAELAKAIKAGKAVYNDKDATLAQVLEANGSVVKAIYSLKLVKPIRNLEEAKRELQANLERGKLYVNSKLYTKASRARLASAIRDGYAVLYNSNASLRDVLKANGRVVKAIYNLELVKGKKPVKKARKVLPQTGVESMSAMAMAAAALVGAGLVASKKRK